MYFPHILVMTASAGSGKTFALSERYVDFILSPDIKASPRNILAITFTNKAAVEMKDRILSVLKKIALAEPQVPAGLKPAGGWIAESALRESLGETLNKLLDKYGESVLKDSADRNLTELLDRYSDFKVQTIDSFLTSITMSSALELGLPPRFEIVLDSSPALNFVLDDLLSQVRAYGTNTGAFLGLLNELLRIDQAAGWDIKKIILENISKLRRQKFIKGQRLKGVFSYRDVEKKRSFLKEAIEEFLEMIKRDKLALDGRFIKAANRFIDDDLFQPWDSKMLLKEHVNEFCNKPSLPCLMPCHEEAWEGIRREVPSLSEMTAHCRFAPFIKIAGLFDNALQSFKNRRQMIFMEDLNVLLESFLSEEGIVPEIYFHLGDRIAHFFIDEFQDTSRLQWQNLFPLIEETLSEDGSLFYVGDKKQAIYGFRGGESALFDEVKDGFDSVRNPDEKPLKINRRSREKIVEFVNDVFSAKNLVLWAESCNNTGDLDLPLLLETYTDSEQDIDPKEADEGGLVRVERIPGDKPLEKAEVDARIGRRLVSLICNEVIPRFSPGDIAILVRTNTEASWVTRMLTGANIPVASERTLNISSNHLVQEVASFLAFLDSPIDNFSFACFISGEIFLKASGLNREEIFSFLLENRDIQRPLYTLFRHKFPQMWQERLEEYFNAVGFLPPYDLLSRILKKYDAFRNFPNEEAFFYQLLELLKQGEAEGRNSLKAFLTLWYSEEEKKEGFQVLLPEHPNAIRVLTIHKAKGLGFRVVISPFTYLNNEAISEVYEEDGGDFIPYRIRKDYLSASSKLTGLYRKEFTAQLINELNAFYVSVTRAKDELYIFLPYYKSMAGKLKVPVFFEGPVFETGSPLVRSPEVVEQREKHIHPPLVNEWQDKLHRPRLAADELVDTARKKARERGTLIHEFLAGIDRLSEKWAEELEEMFSLLSEEIVPLMRKFFSKQDIRRWFVLPDDVHVYREKEIVDGRTNKEYRADRVLVYPEKAVVIEFKSGEPHSEEHRNQVLAYLELLAEICPDKEVEGWLMYVDEATQEKVECLYLRRA
ncbi:MAG: UvrD-helicase domain-containing protein [bacterium]|nr:UvrD-helicase domain-containing protein [bacterium]